MNPIRTTITAFALFACASAAGAVERPSDPIRRDAPKGISEAFYGCIDRADYDSIAVGACLSSEEDVQDARLNRSYKTLMGKLEGKAKEQLVASERAWLAFHSTSSGLETTLYGSEIIANLEVSQRDMFRKCGRANTLETYVSLVSDE
ncbi:lysozyme inhibitor LprI family protein [Frateuria sp. GZRR35]|uniref:lysozyme inhibitor LprI family protein n=1 Tax=unclassified Frateuria TaxID=2648894 RepID=UPI003EDC7881